MKEKKEFKDAHDMLVDALKDPDIKFTLRLIAENIELRNTVKYYQKMYDSKKNLKRKGVKWHTRNR